MIPYSVDASFDRRPVANWVIFGLLVAIGIVQVKIGVEPLEMFALDGWVLGLLTHSWVHLSIFLLIFNALFLWSFGNAVCAKIGNWVYLGLFLGFNLLGGIIHLVAGSGPGSGASVALCGVAGAYLVFFPQNAMNCFFIFPRPITVSVSTFFVVGFWFVADMLLAMVGLKGISYFAHILAFTAGLMLALAALKQGWIVTEKGDISLLDMFTKEEEEEEEEEQEEDEEEKERERERQLQEQMRSAQNESTVMDSIDTAFGKEAVDPAAATRIDDGFIRFYCDCGKKLKVPKPNAGQKGRCPRCNTLLRVPEW